MREIARFRALQPRQLQFWSYYDSFRFLDAGDICDLDNVGWDAQNYASYTAQSSSSETGNRGVDSVGTLTKVTRKSANALAVFPRLGGGALVVYPESAALAKLDNLTDLQQSHSFDFQAVAANCDIDGSCVIASHDGKIYLLEPTSAKLRLWGKGLPQLRFLECSADSENLLAVSAEKLWLMPSDPISGLGQPTELKISNLDPQRISAIVATETGFLLLADQLYLVTKTGLIQQTWTLENTPTGLAGDHFASYLTTVDADGIASLWQLDLPSLGQRSFAG